MYREIIITKDFTTDTARKIVETATDYPDGVFILHDNKRVNAKSIMGVISLLLKKGDTVFVEAAGEDSESIINIICNII
ncbi:MAG: HPr family phosphocarrier protein [Christensenellales bacterium]|jgi:phosphocarrier protein HPr